jgi:aldose 1-epimerase
MPSVVSCRDLFYNNERTTDNGPPTFLAMTAQIEKITDPDSGATGRILVSQGFNCFSWHPVFDDVSREMLWSVDGVEAGDKRPSSSGIPLLFPFPGRISAAKFTFAGREYHLQPGDPFGNAIHGFVFNRPWRVAEKSESRIVGEFRASVDDPSILQHWPADFRIRVSYEARGPELVSQIQYMNVGDGPLPCGFATHAYFRLPLHEGDNVSDTIVTVPVDSYWELEQMVPTGRILPAPQANELMHGLRLADHQFDTIFTGLHSNARGEIQTQITAPASGRSLTQSFDSSFTQCVVYTPGHREAICMEPYTCVPDAIRLSAERHETGLQILRPGERRETTIRLHVT